MNDLIDGILDFSKVGDDKNQNFEKVDLNLTVQKASESIATKVEEKGGNLNIHQLPVVNGHPLLLEQLFQNLLENGIKYNQSSRLQVEIKCQTSFRFHTILFIDIGIGIHQEYFDTVFEMFKRLHTRNEYQGTGIGLALCKKVAIQHGGDLTILTSSKEGTSFKLTLPK